MKNKKRSIFSLIGILILSATFLGCGTKGDPAEFAKLFWNFKIKQDISNVDKLGLTEEEGQEVIDNAKISEMKDLKSMINEMVGAELNRDEYVTKIYNQYIKSLSKNEVTVETESKSSKKSQIKISTTYINITDIIYEAKDKAYNDVKALKLTTDAGIQDNLSKIFTDYFVEGLKNAEITSDTVEKEFTFIYSEEGYWIPEEPQEFMMAIGEMSTK